MLSGSYALFLNRLLHTTVYFWRVSCVWILCWEHKLMPTASPCTALCMHAELWRAHTHRITLHCTVCGGLWQAHTHRDTLHCTMWVTIWDMQSCGSAQCSIILRLHQVLASCIFFFAPLCQFCLKYMEVKGFVERDRRVMVCFWGRKHG